MIIKVIMAQRKESYAGEYAPESLETMSEYDFDENPDWLLDKLKQYKNDKVYDSVAIVDIDVPIKEILKVLYPNPTITGTIKG